MVLLCSLPVVIQAAFVYRLLRVCFPVRIRVARNKMRATLLFTIDNNYSLCYYNGINKGYCLMLPQIPRHVNREQKILGENSMSFGERLKNMRMERRLTQQRLAEAVGVSVVTVRYWESNTKKPAMDALISVATVLRVSTDTLLGISVAAKDDRLALSPAEHSLVLDYRALDTYGKKAVRTMCLLEKERMDELTAKAETNVIELKPKTQAKRQRREPKRERYIPRYTTPSAAGYAVPLDGADFEMLLVDDSVPPQADYAVNIDGNSMYPYIKDGDMVYVQKDVELSIGDIGIFCVDGAMYCKQYYVDDERNMILVSANPKLRHTNVFVGADFGSTVVCYGKVLVDFRPELPDYLFEDDEDE